MKLRILAPKISKGGGGNGNCKPRSNQAIASKIFFKRRHLTFSNSIFISQKQTVNFQTCALIAPQG